mmetsp:Transcript_56169/g.109978  ORF Transcript_56169/g.109978 Transcript_56169/m.109978 type:complete len:128 (-) Transcript_56169:116-499(-)
MFRSLVLCGGLQKQSIVRCADNTGIIKGCIIGLGRIHWGTGGVGHRIRISIRDKTSQCKLSNEPGQLPKGLIIRRRKETGRKDGHYIKFDENAFVVIAKNKPKGTKIKGPMIMETKHNSLNLARYVF